MSGSVPIVTIFMSISLTTASASAQYVHLERVSLWDKIYQFDLSSHNEVKHNLHNVRVIRYVHLFCIICYNYFQLCSNGKKQSVNAPDKHR